MRDRLVKSILGRLSPAAFEAFLQRLLTDTYGSRCAKIQFDGLPMFRRLLPDYVYSPDEGEEAHYGLFEGVYMLDFAPFELLAHAEEGVKRSPSLTRALQFISEEYRGRAPWMNLHGDFVSTLRALYFVSNAAGLDDEVVRHTLVSAYEGLARSLLFPIYPWQSDTIFVGTIDTIADLGGDRTTGTLADFLVTHKDGISIQIGGDGPRVNTVSADKYLTSGVTPHGRKIYEPVFIVEHGAEQLLGEFEKLLGSNPSERALEDFLVAHYKDIFGPAYDRIETQIWLRFPDVDIAGKERRLDIFLRNAIENDWELFEVKRTQPLTGAAYRDVPVLSSEIYHALEQVRNYSRTLAQLQVRRYFAQQGIEYFEPRLHLVIGRQPGIPQAQWRTLVASVADVRILTYDMLLSEMRARLRDRLDFFRQAQSDIAV